MVKSIVADETLLSYVTNTSKENTCTVGIILGQQCAGKNYIIHFAKTPPNSPEDTKAEGINIKQIKSLDDFNENWVADHARHATRMLPGGMYILGIFVISEDDIFNPVNSMIKKILNQVHKQLNYNQYMFGNIDQEKVVFNYVRKTQKYSCKIYDIMTNQLYPAEFKFIPNAVKWVPLACKFEIDQVYNVKTNETEWPLKKHMNVILDQINGILDKSIMMLNGEMKSGDDFLETIIKKKTAKGAPKSQDIVDSNKPIQVSIFQNLTDLNAKSIFDICDAGGQIRVVGQVACKLWLHPKCTINQAYDALKQDIMRSLDSRLEMHWDSLTEEEHSEDVNSIHEPPRRVLVTLPTSKITLSDYLFPGEGPQDVQSSVEEMLDVKIDHQGEIQDVERQVDVTEYYKDNNVLENESEEILPKLNTDTNRFMYLVGLLVALLVLIISLAIHFFIE